MGEILNVENIEQLRQFLNEKGVFEIAVRGKNKKFKAFQKVALNDISQGEAKEKLMNAVNLLNKNNQIGEQSLKMLGNLSKLNAIGLVMNGLNLCATCVGFAIMKQDLDSIKGQINEVLDTIKAGFETQRNYELSQITSKHLYILTCIEEGTEYTEKEFIELIDLEYAALDKLIDTFLYDISYDEEKLIFSILSFSSMLAASIVLFDKKYYYSHKGGKNIWYPNHDNWLNVFNKVLTEDFIKKIQDYGIFKLGLSTIETDCYYISLTDKVKEHIESIEDNQSLIQAFDSLEDFEKSQELLNQDIISEIERAFEEVDVSTDDEDIAKVYENAIKQVVLA